MERTFDRLLEFDARSLAFPIRALLEDRPVRSYTWGSPVILDQGAEGACVGFAWAHELASRPKVHSLVSRDVARGIYLDAQLIDVWPETPPEEGTSVLAGAKTAQQRGYLGEYRWCFDVEDLKRAVGHTGPVVMGTWWWTGMMEPDAAGFVHPTGVREGGHAWLVNGYNLRLRRFAAVQSWGKWGPLEGRFYIAEDDMASLLSDAGEGCVPVVRKLVRELRP